MSAGTTVRKSLKVTSNTRTAIAIRRYGRTPRKDHSIVKPLIDDAISMQRPYSGVVSPSASVITTIRPREIGFIPSSRAEGRIIEPSVDETVVTPTEVSLS